MAEEASGNIRGMAGVPDTLKAALTADFMSGNGSIDAEGLASLLQKLCGDGPSRWDKHAAAQLIEGAGGCSNGNVRLDSLIAWLFAAAGESEAMPLAKVLAASPSFESNYEDEPTSPKIFRSKSTRNWDSPEKLRNASQDVDDAIVAWKDSAAMTEVDPTSPGVGGPVLGNMGPSSLRRRRAEKRANVYVPAAGERLFIPESYAEGVLLLRPGKTFAYVHISESRFSEGVNGEYEELDGGRVLLKPASFGWCYQESFDDEEIVESRHVLTLLEVAREDGRMRCILPDDLVTHFSWMNPTLPEEETAAGGQQPVA